MPAGVCGPWWGFTGAPARPRGTGTGRRAAAPGTPPTRPRR
jgi:hypothetical protein